MAPMSRRPDEDGDSDFRDSCSDGSCDFESDRIKYFRKPRSHQVLSSEISQRLEILEVRGRDYSLQEDCSSDEGAPVNSQGYLLFEYFEHNLPNSHEPLASKIVDLAYRFPGLRYPIYRIPTGPNLKDLDACFLSYYSLYTPTGGVQDPRAPVVTCPRDMDCSPNMLLPVFGLASYKFRLQRVLGTPSGGWERQLVNSLLQATDDFLREHHINHPDYLFFSRR